MTPSSTWAVETDDLEQGHLVHPDTAAVLCGAQVSEPWPGGEPPASARCGDCELREMSRQGLIRLRVGPRQGTLAQF